MQIFAFPNSKLTDFYEVWHGGDDAGGICLRIKDGADMVGVMKPKQNTFRGQIAAAVESCGRSRYALAKATGLTQSTLCRLVSGEGWIGKEGMDALAAELGLMAVLVKKGKSPRKTQRKAKPAGGNAAPLRR